MLYWENEDPANLAVHHLTVLCYHLQHPSLYSPEGLTVAKRLLVDFLERGLSPLEVRRLAGPAVDSGRRRFKIAATAARHGAYRRPVVWSMTVANVIEGGAGRCCENVRTWSRSILDELRVRGEMEGDTRAANTKW